MMLGVFVQEVIRGVHLLVSVHPVRARLAAAHSQRCGGGHYSRAQAPHCTDVFSSIFVTSISHLYRYGVDTHARARGALIDNPFQPKVDPDHILLILYAL